jgi:t-SNARE complex subunit (syntaxin)
MELKSMRQETSRLSNTSPDKRMRQTQEKALAHSLIQLAEEYQNVQSKVKHDQKDELKRQFKLGKFILV